MHPIVSIVAENPEKDLIKVWADIPSEFIVPLPMDLRTPALQERVLVVSSPQVAAQTVSEGLVLSVKGNCLAGNDEMLQITAPIAPGSSGGPVVDMYGNVLGVATAFWKAGRDLTFAVMSRHIAGLQHFAVPKTHLQWYSEKKAALNANLFLDTEPSGATIRILKPYSVPTMQHHSNVHLGLTNTTAAPGKHLPRSLP